MSNPEISVSGWRPNFRLMQWEKTEGVCTEIQSFDTPEGEQRLLMYFKKRYTDGLRKKHDK